MYRWMGAKQQGIFGTPLMLNRIGSEVWTKQKQCMRRSEEKYIGVSWNRATPKSSTLMGFSIHRPSIWGFPIYGSPYMSSQLPWSWTRLTEMSRSEDTEKKKPRICCVGLKAASPARSESLLRLGTSAVPWATIVQIGFPANELVGSPMVGLRAHPEIDLRNHFALVMNLCFWTVLLLSPVASFLQPLLLIGSS